MKSNNYVPMFLGDKCKYPEVQEMDDDACYIDESTTDYYLESNYVFDVNSTVQARNMYDHYVDYCQTERVEPLGSRSFKRKVTNYISNHLQTASYWIVKRKANGIYLRGLKFK